MSLRTLLPAVPVILAASSASCSSNPSSAEPSGPPDAGVESAPLLPALGMNDVSVLLPLSIARAYLDPTSAGAKGALLPEDVYDKVPKFGVEPADGLVWDRMRAVAIRFDACFQTKAGCAPQIRIVMQPILPGGDTNDSALHLFYTLQAEEMKEVVAELRRLRELAPEQTDAPLDVSPAMSAQGSGGAYTTGMKDLVLRFAGEQTLTRMTFFLRAPPIREEWFFGGFDRAAGIMTQLNIVGIGKTNQRVDRVETTEGYSYLFIPAGKVPEDVSALLVTEAAKKAPVDDVKKAYAAFLRIENPTKYGPDALPCAGCHVSTVATEFATKEMGFDPKAEPDAFTSAKWDLTLRGKAATTLPSLRAFGYHRREPMIARRVINESAAAVDEIETKYPR